MLSASDAYVQAAREGRVVVRADVTLADGTTTSFEPDDVMQGGCSFSSATSSAGSFDMGAAIIGRCDLRLRNELRQHDSVAYTGATVVPYVGAMVDGTMEWLRKGTYTVEPVSEHGEEVSLSCVDNMARLERPYHEVATAYPATLGRIVADICEACGVPLASRAFPRSSYVVRHRPDGANDSCIEVLGWAAQVAGCYARADQQGAVMLGWYDLHAFDSVSDLDGGGFHAEADSADGGGFHWDVGSADGGPLAPARGEADVRSLRAHVSTVTVTGLSVVAWDEVTRDGGTGAQGEQAVVGTNAYVIHVKDNPLVDYGRAREVAEALAPSVVGMVLRDVSVSGLGDPTIEAGDPVVATDRLGTTYRFYATQVRWDAGSGLSVACGAESSSPLVRRRRRSASQAKSDAKIEQVEKKATSGVTNSPDLQQAKVIGSRFPVASVGELAPSYPAFGEVQTLQAEVADLMGRTDIGQWTIQVNGVAQTTGTLNLVV